MFTHLWLAAVEHVIRRLIYLHVRKFSKGDFGAKVVFKEKIKKN